MPAVMASRRNALTNYVSAFANIHGRALLLIENEASANWEAPVLEVPFTLRYSRRLYLYKYKPACAELHEDRNRYPKFVTGEWASRPRLHLFGIIGFASSVD